MSDGTTGSVAFRRSHDMRVRFCFMTKRSTKSLRKPQPPSVGEAPESTRATLLHFSACEPLPAIQAMFRSSSKT